MPVYVGDTNNVAREVTAVYIGDTNNVARKVTKIYIGDSNNIAREVWASNSGGLPSGFTRVQYIQSSGTQAIDTGIIPNEHASMLIDITFALHTTPSSVQQIFSVLGSSNSRTVRTGLSVLTDGETRIYDRINNATIVAETSLNTEYRVQWNLANASTSVNDGAWNTYTTNLSYDLPSEQAIHLCCQINVAGTMQTFSTCRIYGTAIYESLGGSILRNFIPCYRDQDNEVGLYDTVTNALFTNVGTGSFTAGPIYEGEL